MRWNLFGIRIIGVFGIFVFAQNFIFIVKPEIYKFSRIGFKKEETNLSKGLFISFEGIDGCGKTTQAEKLAERLRHDTFTVLTLRDPGGTRISEAIRRILLEKSNAEMGIMTELLLYESARAQIVFEKIHPGLKENDVVIIDRFFDSTMAYQGYGREIDLEKVKQANLLATGGVTPDVTFFIDIAYEESLQRKGPSTPDRLENENQDFFNRIRNGYLEIAQSHPKRVRIIDGMQGENAVAEQIYKETKKLTSGWILARLK